jgi:hypothetical protein
MDDAELVKECRSFLFYAATVKEPGCEAPSPEWCEQASRALNAAASRIESLSAELTAHMELLQEIDSHWRRGEYGKAADHHRDQVTAALAERGASDKHE